MINMMNSLLDHIQDALTVEAKIIGQEIVDSLITGLQDMKGRENQSQD